MKKFLLSVLLVCCAFSGHSQFLENFDDPSVLAPAGPNWALPSGIWSLFQTGGGASWALNSQQTGSFFTAPNAAFAPNADIGNGNTSESWLVTPAITAPPNAVLRFTAQQLTSQTQGTQLKVMIAPATVAIDDTASYSALGTYFGAMFDNPEIAVALEVAPGSSFRIAFVRTFTQSAQTPTGNQWVLDNVRVTENCPTAAQFTSTSSQNSVTLNWVAQPAEWQVHVVPESFTFNPNAAGAITTSTNSVVITQTTQPTAGPLQLGSTYKVYVRSLCSGATGIWTQAIVSTIGLPSCGNIFTDSGGTASNYSSNENQVVTICPDNPDNTVLATFTAFETEAQFDALYVYNGSTTFAPMFASDNGPGNVPNGVPGGYWGNTIPGPFQSTSPDGCLTFLFISDAVVNLSGFVANISCQPPGTCPKPIALTTVNATDSTTFSWTEVGNANSWEVFVQPCGSPMPTFSSDGMPTSTTSITLTDLTPGTCYEFYVRSLCGYAPSAWAGPAGNENNDTTRFLLKAFVDANENGLWDTNESPFTFGAFAMDINDSGNASQFVSNSGQVSIPQPDQSATYDFSFSIFGEYAAYYSVTQSPQLDVAAPAFNTTQEIFFPIYIEQPYLEVATVIVATASPRPGLPWINYVGISNNGTGTASGNLNFTKDPVLGAVNIITPGPIASTNGFNYDFTDLAPGTSQWFSVSADVPTIPTVSLNQPLTNTATVAVSGDINPGNNTFSVTREVKSSYDPNDIMEAHGPQILVSEFTDSDYLYYTVRFQNTGNAEALDVRIESVLDSQLDFSSIRMVAASHNYVLQQSGNELTWLFEDINLTWQAQSEELSQGFLVFKIKVIPGFAAGDTIAALADIYFDTNPAIITETFTTTFVNQLSVGDVNANDFVMFPNPAKGQFTVSGNGLEKVTVLDLLGKTMLVTLATKSDTSIEIDQLQSGMYLVELQAADGSRSVRKLIVK